MFRQDLYGCLDKEGNIYLKAISNKGTQREYSINTFIHNLEYTEDAETKGKIIPKFYNFRAGTVTKITMTEAYKKLGKDMNRHISEFRVLAEQELKVIPFSVSKSYYGEYAVTPVVAYRGKASPNIYLWGDEEIG